MEWHNFDLSELWSGNSTLLTFHNSTVKCCISKISAKGDNAPKGPNALNVKGRQLTYIHRYVICEEKKLM